jgi:phage shock protein A
VSVVRILSRLKEIFTGNVNAALERTEDPMKAIDEYMRRLNSDLGKTKAEVASLLANEARARRALDECESEIDKLQRYAEKALVAGEAEAANTEGEVEARKFLQRKMVEEDRRTQLQTAHDRASSNTKHMRQIQDKLMSAVGELETRRFELKEKMSAAQAQQRMNSLGSATLDSHDTIFGMMEEQVNNAYNEAMAIAELRDGATTWTEKDKDTQLAAMKDRLNKKEDTQ